MHKKLWLFACLLFLCGAAAAQELTADQIIAKNVQAKGGLEKIRAVKSVRLTGKLTVGPGMEAPFTMMGKRPNNTRMEFTIQGMTIVQAYDGKTGWKIVPFTGKKDPEPMGADELKDAEEQADIDGPLVDYQAKGHKVEYAGKEAVEGGEAYKLKLTRKNGDIEYFYIDPDSFLEIKTTSKRTIRDAEQEVETTIGDWKQVEGIMFPFSIEQSAKGSPQTVKITVEKIELNVPLEDTQFKMPAPPPAAAPAEKKQGN